MRDLFDIQRDLFIGTVLQMAKNGNTPEEISEKLNKDIDNVNFILDTFRLAD